MTSKKTLVMVWKHFLDPSKDSINEWWELPLETIEDVNNPNTNSASAVGNVTSVSPEGRIIQMCGTCFNKLFNDLSRPSIESYMSTLCKLLNLFPLV